MAKNRIGLFHLFALISTKRKKNLTMAKKGKNSLRSFATVNRKFVFYKKKGK